nr:MAG TPA: DNA binding protein [Caudoviricetes sp.]
MASVKAKFRPSVIEGKEGTVYYQIIQNRVIRQLKTDYRIFADEWNDAENNIIIGNSERSNLLLSLQERMKWDLKRFEMTIRKLGNQKSTFTVDEIIGFFQNGTDEQSFFNFMQGVILDEVEAEGNLRGYQLPIMPDKRKKPDKLQRIEAVSPLWERGFVFYNEKLKESPDMQTGIEQTLALERGSRIHDDAPDADEGAIWMLQRNSRQESFQPVFGKRPTAKNIW